MGAAGYLDKQAPVQAHAQTEQQAQQQPKQQLEHSSASAQHQLAPTECQLTPTQRQVVPKRFSASIVTYNSASVIGELLESMQAHLDLSKIDVYVIDNASSDGTPELILACYPWVILLRNADNKGFGAAHNQVILRLESDIHFIINPDIVFISDAVSQIAAHFSNSPQSVIVSPRFYFKDGSEQHLPKRLPDINSLLARRIAPNSKMSRRINDDYTMKDICALGVTDVADLKQARSIKIENASGAFIAIRSSALRDLQGFDERFFIYFEDNDLCKRASDLRLGNIVYLPAVEVVHGYARSSKHSCFAKAQLLRSAWLYFRKHGIRISRPS